jgi:hypothetical protein
MQLILRTDRLTSFRRIPDYCSSSLFQGQVALVQHDYHPGLVYDAVVVRDTMHDMFHKLQSMKPYACEPLPSLSSDTHKISKISSPSLSRPHQVHMQRRGLSKDIEEAELDEAWDRSKAKRRYFNKIPVKT